MTTTSDNNSNVYAQPVHTFHMIISIYLSPSQRFHSYPTTDSWTLYSSINRCLAAQNAASRSVPSLHLLLSLTLSLLSCQSLHLTESVSLYNILLHQTQALISSHSSRSFLWRRYQSVCSRYDTVVFDRLRRTELFGDQRVSLELLIHISGEAWWYSKKQGGPLVCLRQYLITVNKIWYNPKWYHGNACVFGFLVNWFIDWMSKQKDTFLHIQLVQN